MKDIKTVSHHHPSQSVLAEVALAARWAAAVTHSEHSAPPEYPTVFAPDIAVILLQVAFSFGHGFVLRQVRN